MIMRVLLSILVVSILLFSCTEIRDDSGTVKKQCVLTLQPDSLAGKDAMISSSNPGQVFSSAGIYASNGSWSGAEGVSRSLISIDMSVIPGNIIIDSALLILTPMTDAFSTRSDEDALLRVTDHWQEKSGTWNYKPAPT